VQWGLMAACTRSGARATILCSLLSRDGGKTFFSRPLRHSYRSIMFAVVRWSGRRLFRRLDIDPKSRRLYGDLDRLS